MIFSDVSLARKLERTEAHANATFVEARHRVDPALGARWLDIDGTYAMFDGVGSPLTQTFGLGMFSEVTFDTLQRLEEFFRERGAAVYHEVSPLADPSHLMMLGKRGYQPIELTSVLYRADWPESLHPSVSNAESVQVNRITASEAGRGNLLSLWAEVSARGWAPEQPDLYDFLKGLGEVTAAKEDPLCFVASIDGKPVGAAGMHIHQDVALLAGASTLPAYRRRGVQFSLLQSRMNFAREAGCQLVMMGALPGSPSQRNAERHGFRIAYTRTKWGLGV